MKKIFLRLALLFGLIVSPISAIAQTKTAVIKAGTVVELKSLKTVYAREVEVGDNVKFEVVGNVVSNGEILIPAGTIANGIVTDARKSSLAGTKGRLSVDIKSLALADGIKVPLSGMVRVTGKNRTPLAVVAALFVWPCIFIPGTKAVMTEGSEATATVVANTEVPVN